MNQRIFKLLLGGPLFGPLLGMSLVLACWAQTADAKTAKVGRLSFEVKSPWFCSLEGSELVCVKTDPENPKDSNRDQLIVVTARNKTAQDSIKSFHRHLKTPKSFTAPDGVKYTGLVKYVRERKISGKIWVDSEQYQSEVPGYVTRYFASIIGQTVVIATFSAKKDLFEDFNAETVKLVEAFKVSP